MAIGAASPHSPGTFRNYNAKVTGYVVLICLIAASGGLLFGYDIGITGGVTAMPAFQQRFFPDVYRQTHDSSGAVSMYCQYDNQLLQLFTSSLFIAGLLSSLVASWTTSRWGRRATMLMAGIAFCIGAALTAGAVHLAMLVVGRISLGVGVGFANQAVPLYLSEMAPPQLRGGLNIMFQMATTIGILAAQLVNYGTHRLSDYGWRISLAGAGVPALMLTLGALFLPDTPNSLLDRGFARDAEAVLRRVRGVQDISVELTDIQEAAKVAAMAGSRWTTIFKRQYRAELTMAIMIPLFQQFTGINSIMFYAPVLFSSLGSGETTALVQTIITGAVNVLATVVAIVVVDRGGRRMLFFEGGVQMALAEICMAGLIAWNFRAGAAALSSGMAIGIIVLVCVFTSGFAWSWGPLGWLVPSEIQPLETRSTGQAITVSTNFVFTAVIGQAFLTMLCNMQYGIFLFFAGCVAIMTVFVALFLPETKGVPLEEIVDLWKQHWYWKRFTNGGPRAPADAELAAVQARENPNAKPVPAAAPPAANNGTSPDCYYTI